MEDNKYYNPDIEEFCYGFEFEYMQNKEWNKAIFGEDGIYDLNSPELNIVRTKYLDHLDVESLGFEITKKPIDSWGEDEYWAYSEKTSTIDITFDFYDDGSSLIELFGVSFKIKNKSELKKALQMLNIDYETK